MPRHHQFWRRLLASVVSASAIGSGIVVLQATSANAGWAVPPTPTGLPNQVEDAQPYVGQAICDPVAKPGVVAFRNMLLSTYPTSGSFGIVRDCGSGGQSEHKEGRAFDWKVSAYNSSQAGQVGALLNWLTKADANGNQAAMARRLGVMYMIWNRKIWKSYDDRGWQAYSGASPHTDHVHFSFGWNGAKKVTSYWDKTWAPVDFGPRAGAPIVPVRSFANIALVRKWGGTTLKVPSSGEAVTLVQRALKVSPVDGDYGTGTSAVVAKFQADQRLPITQRFALAEWKRLFPPPAAPFGKLDPPGFALGNALVTGWAIDGDTTAPVTATAYVDGVAVQTSTADQLREDVRTSFPEYGGNHGFLFALPSLDVGQSVCVTAHNAANTVGTDTRLGCAVVQESSSPLGILESATSAFGVVNVSGWAFDGDSPNPVAARVFVNGVEHAAPVDPVARLDIAERFPGVNELVGLSADLDLPQGSHTVCMTAVNTPGTEGTDTSLGCRAVVVQHDALGSVEAIRRAPGGVLVSGWGLDPDLDGPATVVLLSDGAVVRTLIADAERPALSTRFPELGTAHGFTTVLDLPVGNRTVCVRVLNAEGTVGNAATLPCTKVTISHDPAGVLGALRTVPGGSVLIAGEAYDPDTLSASTVTVLLDGKAARTVTANRASSQRWAGYGAARGFTASLTPSAGKHTICAVLNNASGTSGAARTLSCRVVVVHDGTGALTSMTRSGRTLSLGGWAIDPDTSASTVVSLVVDGRIIASRQAAAYRGVLATVAPGYGNYHGYSFAQAVRAGTHNVCVIARNVRGTLGSSRYIGCRSVVVP